MKKEYDKGGWIPGGPVPIVLDPDECVVDITMTCRRADHPTPTSDCTTKKWIHPPRRNDDVR